MHLCYKLHYARLAIKPNRKNKIRFLNFFKKLKKLNYNLLN